MLRFIFADLRRLWPGAVVVVVLVALAVALGATVTLQERALRLGSARASDKFDLVIGAPGSETQLVLSTVFLQPAALPLMHGDILQRLNADPRVAWAAPVGFGDSFDGYPIVGTSRALLRDTASGVSLGRIFAAEGEAVVGAAVPLAPGAHVASMHGEADTGGQMHEGVGYRVVGRLAPTGTPWDRAILVPIQAVWHVHDLDAGQDGAAAQGHDQAPGGVADHDPADGLFELDAPLDETWGEIPPGLPAILVKPKSIADAYALRREYRLRPDTVGVFPAEVLTGLYAMMGDARSVLSAIAVGTQALVAAALLLVAVIHVGQRRRQIGALRALGAPRWAIFGIVWGELSVLLLAGAVIGLGLGYLAASLMAQAFSARQGFPLPVEFSRDDLGGLALLGAASVLIPLIPAALVWRQPPLAAMRS
ncbi:ABC transporter permease [Sinirhodobacter ferrireducens]|uniref:ABC transporter permease n=1 Tax=Paenirhodobacter ferrireducens TaxID=1215032 RepID=A0A443LUP1_9RHOB|nr:ABC transporter permease [Sinirhodobacter ferrireducens]RWR52910.1 ABC transporter permease [Sinirhodobacter ferrireducens]